MSAANVDDGRCTFPLYGCADQAAINYDAAATLSAGCLYSIRGCADSGARNYEADVTEDVPHSCARACVHMHTPMCA